MAPPSSLSTVQSATPVMASNLTDGIVGSRFFSTKKISVLLDDTNYLLWRQQVFLVIKTYKLQSFLDLHTVPPSQLLPGDDGVPQENLEFTQFEQQDSALASWLLSLVSPTVLSHPIGLDTNAQIWNALVNLYGSKTTSQLMFYRRALHSQHKGDLSMKDFLMKFKSYYDNLASFGEVISEHEHVTATLNRLPTEYESDITIIIASQIPYNVQGATTMLIDTEARQQVTIFEAPSSANIVSHQSADPVSNSTPPPAYRPSSTTRGRRHGRSSRACIQCYRPPHSPQANVCMFRPESPITPWVLSSISILPPAIPNSQPSWFFPLAPVPTWTKALFGNLAFIESTANGTYLGWNKALEIKIDGGEQVKALGNKDKVITMIAKLANGLATWGSKKENDGRERYGSVIERFQRREGLKEMIKGKVEPQMVEAVVLASMENFFKSVLNMPEVERKLRVVVDAALEDHPYCSQLYLYSTTDKKNKSFSEKHFTGKQTEPNPFSVNSPQHVSAPTPTNSHPQSYFATLETVGENAWYPNSTVTHHLTHSAASLGDSPSYNGPDEYTRYIWVYFLWKKSEVLTTFPQFHKQAEKALGFKLQALQIDEGRVSTIEIIVEAGLSMLAYASMPLTYWNDAFNSAIYLINRLNHATSFLESLAAYVSQTLDHTTLTNSSFDQPPFGIFKPKAYMSTILCLSTKTPANIHEAMRHEFWKATVHNELQALLHNNTWSICSLSINRRAIGCKWLFKVKKNADGTVERYKARLVAKGFSQHTGFNFRDTFKPVVRAVTIQTVLAIAVMKRWSL
ncbi:uncharacterized protein LOC108466209 [Gossypium arboreum]|uniref:uncharacterized protein LOC108466209 n=1 Tax=Gossypium arboreum TaxID=29729 RepID=UPI0008194313|nr:uncharacterized protein LOC108466209 [Gossypium arboreum]